MEVFTAVYSDMPHHVMHFEYLFFGLGDKTALVPWMWASETLAVLALVLLIIPRTRHNVSVLTLACVAVFASIWIDKGLGMVVTGFVPSPLGAVTEYWPTFPEVMISVGIYSLGLLMITGFYKIVLSVRKELPA
jgi:molybdopterin-containing oxidoreductase family membrane subunit